MHDSYFTFPLTVKVRVDGWHSAVAVQNGEEVPVSIITNAAVTYALVDAVPDLGTVTLTEAAAAAFSATPQSGWTPLTVTFTDTETGTVSRVWDFGDGATSNTTAQAVEHTYVAAGVYSVELVSGGVTNTRVDYITVTAPVAPTAGFSASPLSGAIPLSVAFTDTSTGDITNRVWTFGDGASETTSATSVYHTYTNAGTYDVSLIARGPSGADTNTQAGVITATAPVPPTAIFNAAPLSGSIPLTVNFTDDSTGSIADRVWDFGDGTTTNTTDLYMSHTYTSAGTYSVQLVVNGPAGAHTNTQTDLITATNPPPPANVIQVAGDPADRSIGSSSNGVLLLLSTTATLPRIADDNFSNNQGACTVVLVFRLPDLEGQRVVSADLSTWFEASWIQSAGALPNDPADNVLPKWVDLYGVRWSTGSTVLTNDYGYKTVGTANGIRLQEQFLYQSTHENMGGNPVEAVTDELGAANLAAWMQAQYDDGAQPGDYVFLRLHAAFASAGFFGVYSAENADTAKRPVLTLGLGTAGGSTPPPPTAVFGSASLGRGLDVINWTPVQGSGFVYSVWFSTNLMEGFQPLETNLPDTVQSLTNAIQAPSVFYKIDVQ
jgi:PKD repeat protein